MNEIWAAVRLLLRSRWSSLMIIGLLALGLGAGTTIFAVFDVVVMRPLAVQNPEQLVRMVQHLPKMGTRSSFPHAYIETLRAQSRSFAAVFGETGAYLHFVMSDPAPAEQITVHAVTPEYFAVLGVPALYGRVLTAEDARRAGDLPPAVLSFQFWSRRFNADRAAIQGRTVVINKRHFAIVGVMPRSFNGIAADTAPDVRVPFGVFQQIVSFSPDLMGFEVAARLKPGVTRNEAEAEAKTLWHSTMSDYYRNVQKLPPEVAAEQLSRGMALEPLERGVSLLRDRFGDALRLLTVSIGVLVVIVCTNVAGLVVARALARQQETAIRVALGATRMQLARQVVAESFWYVLSGAVVAAVVAYMLIPVAISMLPPIRDLSGSIVPIRIDGNLSRRPAFFLIILSMFMILIHYCPANEDLDAGK